MEKIKVLGSDYPPSNTLPAYRIASLVKTYGEGPAIVQALRGVDLEMPAGEIVVLLGPSGSGKSTALRCINALESFDSGQIRVGDTGKQLVGAACSRDVEISNRAVDDVRHQEDEQRTADERQSARRKIWFEKRTANHGRIEKHADEKDA